MYMFTERPEVIFLLCRGKQVQISDSWFVGNQADNSGAGLVFDKTSAYVQGSVFKNNRAQASQHTLWYLLSTTFASLPTQVFSQLPAGLAALKFKSCSTHNMLMLCM